MTIAEKIALLRRALQRRLEDRLAPHTSRPFSHLRALRAIGSDGVRTQVALCHRLLIDAPAASRIIDRLVSEGLLTRRPGKDRRSVHLELTRSGRAEVVIVDR